MTELLIPGGELERTDGSRIETADIRRPMIVADNVHVTYKVYASGKRTKASDNRFDLRTLQTGRGLKEVPAVRGISFAAYEGETVGVVGHNGSGKSTLFSAMSGLIPASQGAVWARERPVLLGVNAALLPQLSGENNIKLGLMAMGLGADEAAARVDEIADFAELNEFIDHPMRTYSAGMGARLRFAIASAKAHSILLVDEALSVGDRRFKAKSEQRIRELRDSAGLVMIVSHSIGALKDTCERVLWVHKGELRADGPAKDVIDEYVKWTKQPNSVGVGAAPTQQSRNAPVPAQQQPKPKGVADGEEAAGLVAFEELMADAARSAEAAAKAAADRHNARDVARKERHRRTVRERTRRRTTLVVLTGAAVILAVAAGAAVAFLTGVPRQAEVDPRATPAVSQAPRAEAGGEPEIRGFSANSAIATCASEEGEVQIELSWAVDDAVMLAVAAGDAQVDAIDAPLAAQLPDTAAAYPVVFSCGVTAQIFTLTAEGQNGARVSATVTVARELVETTTEPDELEGTSPVVPRRPAQVPAPAPQPSSPVDPQPAPEPAPEPEPEPAPEPEPEPEPEPTQIPEPEPTQVPEPQPEPSASQGTSVEGGA